MNHNPALSDIIVSNASDKPIYEQVSTQLKDAILQGKLKAGEPLPSIRALANALEVSVITTKRAYADLEAQGFIDTMPGRGSFVAAGGAKLLEQERKELIQNLLIQAAQEAQLISMDDASLHALLDDALQATHRP